MATVLLTSCLFQNTPGPHLGLLAGSGLQVVPLRGPLPESELLSAVGGVDALLCDDDDITAAVVERASPRLRLISKVGGAVTSIDTEACARHGVMVRSTGGLSGHAVVELTMGLILSLARNIHRSAEALREGRWHREPGNELMGRRLGVVGLGRVGRDVARLARCFGMTVRGFSPSWPEDFATAHSIGRADSIGELAGGSDILTLHPRLTPETRGMVDAALLARMPPGALLINTSRAALVDHTAVLRALESGHLGGFASDVPESEPSDPDDPLMLHPRALITPHLGSFTFQGIPRLLEKAAENLVEFFAGPG